jgi:hypothetical protein
MTIRICDRCGDITLHGERCTCSTPYSLMDVRRRHQAAVASARITAERERSGGAVESGRQPAAAAAPTGPSSPGDERATPRRTAAAAVSGQRAQARVSGRDSMSISSGVSTAHTDAAPPALRAPRPALDPDWLDSSDADT